MGAYKEEDLSSRGMSAFQVLRRTREHTSLEMEKHSSH
jgi:hypothetical protein